MVSVKEKKFYFSITFLNVIKINSGYLDLKNANAKLSLANGKFKILTMKDFFISNDSVNFVKHFTLLKVSSAILLGVDIEEYKVYIVVLINTFNPIIYSILSQKYSYVKFRNDVILLGENSSTGGITELVVATNAISILAILIKKFANKIVGGNNAKRKNQQQNS